jgi:hypothetical protein
MVATIFSQGRFNMRKVLLATTALVALNVSAASADISLSGGYDFSYIQYSSGAKEYAPDGNVKLKATSTTDSGLALTAYQSVGIHTGTEEDSYIQIGGDFGKFQLGGADSVIDGMDGDVSHFANDWTTLTENHNVTKVTGDTATAVDKVSTDHTKSIVTNKYFQGRGEAGLWHAIGGLNHSGDGGMKIGYVSPTISNVTVAISSASNGDELSYAAKYKNGPIAVMGGVGKKGNIDDSALGFGITLGDAVFRYQQGTTKVGDTNSIARNEVGVTYTMGDVGLFAGQSKEREKKHADKDKLNISGVGATYAVAPGLTLTTEYFKASNARSESESSTSVSLSVKF